LEHIALLVLLLALFETQEPIGYGASFEDGGEVLVLDELFLGGDIDPEGRFGGWRELLAHLAQVGFFVTTGAGQTIRVRRGPRW
jgi:hypothetical protein